METGLGYGKSAKGAKGAKGRCRGEYKYVVVRLGIPQSWEPIVSSESTLPSYLP